MLTSELELVPPTAEDAPLLGQLCYDAFDSYFTRYNQPPDFPNSDVTRGLMELLLSRPDFYGVAARREGRIIGGNFYSKTDAVAGVGPIFVEPGLQSGGVGRALMEHVVEHALANHGSQVRLVQDAPNMVSLSLYASIGFDVREVLALMELVPAAAEDETVRAMTEADLDRCDELCRRIYKVSRRNEVAVAVTHGAQSGTTPHLRERDGRIVGYAIPGFFGHGVAETNEDLFTILTQALRRMPSAPIRWFCPLRNTDLFRRALAAGARSLRCMNLMSVGPYEEPGGGAWSPGILY